MKKKTGKLRALLVALAALALLLLVYWWANLGYGKVSPRTYQFSKALYSACLNKNEEHLAKVNQMLSEQSDTSIPPKEQMWLQQIVDHARNGKWETAAKKARRMMIDQLEYGPDRRRGHRHTHTD